MSTAGQINGKSSRAREPILPYMMWTPMPSQFKGSPAVARFPLFMAAGRDRTYHETSSALSCAPFLNETEWSARLIDSSGIPDHALSDDIGRKGKRQ